MSIQNKDPHKVIWTFKEEESQRVDNFLFRHFRYLPKPLIYRLLRKKKILVNGKKSTPSSRLSLNDTIQLPMFLVKQSHSLPIEDENKEKGLSKQFSFQVKSLLSRTIWEDEGLLILNKPHQMSCHKGSSEPLGLIEILNTAHNEPHSKWELIHRLDKPTTGCLAIAKNRSILKQMQDIFRKRQVKKHYLAVCEGLLDKTITKLENQLTTQPFNSHRLKPFHSNNPSKKTQNFELKSVVSDFKNPLDEQNSPLSKLALTYVRQVWHNEEGHQSLLWLQIATGRTHQIRAQLAHLNHPVVGDDKYGKVNRRLQKFDKHNKHNTQESTPKTPLLLHAWKICFTHPKSGQMLEIEAPLPPALQSGVSCFKGFSNAHLKQTDDTMPHHIAPTSL